MTAPVDLTQPSYRTLLLGMKGSSSYVYRIVATSSAGTCTSQDYTIMTGAVPSSVPKPTVDDHERRRARQGLHRHQQRHHGDRRLDLRLGRRTGLVGDRTVGTSRIEMSWDGSKMYMMALNVQNSGAGKVNIVNMDGTAHDQPRRHGQRRTTT